MKNSINLLIILAISFSIGCKKEEKIETTPCPKDTFMTRYENNLDLPDSTLVYWGNTYKLTDINLVYSASGDYSIKIKAPGVELDILFRPPSVKNCSRVLQTESTLPYSSKLASGSGFGFGMVLWDSKNYQSTTACQTSDSDALYGYVKMTTYDTTFNLSFANVLVQSQMFWSEPKQPVSLNLTLPFDCSVVCPVD